MSHSVIKKIKKYIRLYIKLLRFSFIESTTYRISFIIEMTVEIGYQVVFFLFFKIIYYNIKEIAGWSYYEVLFLAGLDTIVVSLLWGLVCIYNLRNLPGKIRNGDLDIILTKPLNSLFGATLFKPYLTGIFDSISGIFIMIYSLRKIALKPSLLDISSMFISIVFGLIIAYSILIMITSLSFVFTNTETLPHIGEKIILFSSNPHHIYKGLLRKIFFYILPVVFISSIPASSILRGININHIILGFILSIAFLTLAVTVWNKMIKYYSSASS